MQQIIPGIFLPSHLRVANCYFIKAHTRLYMIDTGVAFERFFISRALKHFPESSLEAIFLTHSHADHAGNAKFFAQKYSTPVFCSQPEHPFLLGTDKMKSRAYEGFALMTRFIHFWDWVLGQPIYKATKTFSESDRFKKDFQFIPIHGHTRGSGAILHQPTGALFLGDCLLNCNPLKLSMPVGLRLPYACFSENLDHAKKNLALLRTIDFRHAFFGHGPPLLKQAKPKILKFLDHMGI